MPDYAGGTSGVRAAGSAAPRSWKVPDVPLRRPGTSPGIRRVAGRQPAGTLLAPAQDCRQLSRGSAGKVPLPGRFPAGRCAGTTWLPADQTSHAGTAMVGNGSGIVHTARHRDGRSCLGGGERQIAAAHHRHLPNRPGAGTVCEVPVTCRNRMPVEVPHPCRVGPLMLPVRVGRMPFALPWVPFIHAGSAVRSYRQCRSCMPAVPFVMPPNHDNSRKFPIARKFRYRYDIGIRWIPSAISLSPIGMLYLSARNSSVNSEVLKKL